MESVNIPQLKKIAKGEAKLNPDQHIPYQNNWDTDDSFTLIDKADNAVTTLEVSKNASEIVSIQKSVVTGETTEYYKYYPDGSLKEKNIYLKSSPIAVPTQNIYYDKVKIGTHYLFDKAGNVESEIDYKEMYTYSLDDILIYCSSMFPGKQVTISQVYLNSADDVQQDPGNDKIKKDYPYWSLNVAQGGSGRTITTEVYIIDGKTGTEVSRNVLRFTMGQ